MMEIFKKKSPVFRVICALLIFLLVQNNLAQVQAQPAPFLPSPNYIDLSPPYDLPVLRGMRVDADKPFQLDFVVDSGDRHTLDQKETSLLIKYFLTFLTIPEEDLWVNLSPYEAGRVIPDDMALTNAGNTLLEQDKLLKQLSSSLTYPENSLGKKFWEKVYKIAYEKYGTTDLPINTYNKVWIVPDKAVVYDMGDSALIGDTHLKVMLEEDYLALKKNINKSDKGTRALHTLTAEITKEIILPELEKEINTGKNFAPVRQILHSLVLADWFKRELRRDILSDVYVNKKKISGVDGVDKDSIEKIYKQYLHIFKVGAYNYIREDVDPITNQAVPRKYFSGGFFGGDSVKWVESYRIFDRKVLESGYFPRYAGSNFAMASVKLKAINQGNPAQMVLPRYLRKFVTTIALAVTLLAPQQGRSTQVQEYVQKQASSPIALMADAQNQFVHIPGTLGREDIRYVQMANQVVTLNDVKALNGLTNPLPGGGKYNIDIPWMERNWNAPIVNNKVGWVQGNKVVAFQHKNLLPENGQLNQETRNALITAVGGTPSPQPLATHVKDPAVILPTQAPFTPVLLPNVQPATGLNDQRQVAPALHVNNAPQVDQHASSFEHNKKVYTYTPRSMLPTPVINEMVSYTSGVVTGLNTQEKNYDKKETVLTVFDKENRDYIEALKGDISDKEGTLKDKEVALKEGAASPLDVVNAKLLLLDLQKNLAGALAQEKLGIKKAPYDHTVNDFKVVEGDTVDGKTVLSEYYDRDRLRFDIEIPDNVYFETMSVTLDGKPAQSNFWFNWSPTTPHPHKIYLSLIVTPTPGSQPDHNRPVNLSATFYTPDNGPKIPVFKGKASTIVPVAGKIKEYTKKAPAADIYEFKVNQGDWVKTGQVMVQGDPQPFKIRLEYVLTQKEGEQIKLSRATFPDGNVIINQDEVNKIKSTIRNLERQEEDLRYILAHLDIKADQDGKVVWTAQNGSDAFQKENDLVTINNDTVILGDLNNNPILLSGVKEKMMVEGFTPAGPVLGHVTAVDPTPLPSTREAGPVQSARVTFEDPNHFIRQGMQLPVILLTDQEAVIAEGILKANLSLQLGAGSPPPPDPLAGFVSGLFAPNAVGQFITPKPIQSYYPPQGPDSNSVQLNFVQLDQMVNNNPLLFIEPFSTLGQKKLAEHFASAKKLSLTGSLFRSGNGSISGFGGASGVINGVTAALTPGGLAKYGATVLGDVLGNFIDIIDGKIGKEGALARADTNSWKYSLESAKTHQFNNANDLLIELRAVQYKIAASNALMADLKEAQREMIAAESYKLIEHLEKLKLDKQISVLQGEIEEFQREEKAWTFQLNNLKGQKIHDGQPIVADVLMTGIFPGITDDPKDEKGKIDQWLEEITGPQSKDPRMQKARADLEVVEKSIVVQGLKKLPAIYLGTNITAPNLPVSALPYDPLAGFRTPAQQGGVNLEALVEVPVFDQKTSIEKNSVALQKQAAERQIEKTKNDLTEELERAVNNIRKYSEEINTAEAEYQTAYDTWKIYASQPGVYVPYKYYTDRKDLWDVLHKIIDLKAKYLAEVETLKELGVLGPNETLVKADVSSQDKAQLSVPSSLRKFMFGLVSLIAFAVMPLYAQDRRLETPVPSIPYTVYAGGQPSSGILNDSNSENRKQTLDALEKSQGIDSLERIAISSSPSERHELLRSIVDRKPIDLPFFIRMINNAAANHDQPLVDQGIQFLDDIFFTMSPEALQKLAPENFNNDGITPEIANNVFMTYLLRAPDDSVGKERFLRSNYWTLPNLAGMYRDVNANARNDRLMKLAKLIKTMIFIKQASGNVHETFRPADFFNLGSIVFERDVRTYVEITNNEEQNSRFLNISPEAWGSSTRDYIHPDLYTSAVEATENLILTTDTGSSGFSSSVLYKLSDPLLTPDPLAYFQSLGPEAQVDHISQLTNIPELARILALNTPWQGLILDRLMPEQQGRVMALKVYLDSHDTKLRDLIQKRFRSSQNQLKADIEAVQDSATNRIYRLALERMNEDWALNLRLKTFTNLELQAATDPRGQAFIEAEMRRRATEIGLKILGKQIGYKPEFAAGHRLQNTSEVSEQLGINGTLDQEDDPVKFNAYIDERARNVKDPQAKGAFRRTCDNTYNYVYRLLKGRDTGAKGMFEQLTLSLRPGIAEKISHNDQTIPPIPFIRYFLYGILVGGPILFVFIKKSIQGLASLKRRNDVVATIIHISGQETNLEEFYSLDKEDLLEPTKKMVEKINGFKIINMPEPNLKPKTKEERELQENLKDWWLLVNNWNQVVRSKNEGNLQGKDVVNDLHKMRMYALNALKLMPYTPQQMESASPVFKRNLFYLRKLANYTLYLLRHNLKNKGLSDDQKDQLQKDIDTLVKSVKYATNFSLLLHYRAILNRVFNRMLSAKHWYEKLSLYSLARRFLYFEWLLRSAKQGIEKILNSLFADGNDLIPGLYANPTKTINDSKGILNRIIARGGTSDARAYHAEYSDKNGNFWREFKYVIQLILIAISTLGLAFGIRGFVSFSVDITFSGLYFLFWSWFWYSKPNWDAMNTKGWGAASITLAEKQAEQLYQALNLSASNAAQVSSVLPVQAANRDRDAAFVTPEVKKPGGIDLNFHPQYIERFSRGSSLTPKGFAANMPEGFKGFNFNIVRFTPNLTVNGAFQLMFDLN